MKVITTVPDLTMEEREEREQEVLKILSKIKKRLEEEQLLEIYRR